jgi:O-antigen ligase
MKGLIFTYLMCYGGSVVALFRPWYGFLIYVAFALVKPDQRWGYSLPEGNYSRIVAVAFLVGWLFSGMGSWKFAAGGPTMLALVAYAVWSTISAAVADGQAAAWTWVEGMWKIVLPAVAGLTLIDSEKRLKQLAWVIAISLGYFAFSENQQYLKWGVGEGDNGTAHELACGVGVCFFLGLHSANQHLKLLLLGCAALMVHATMFHMSRGAMIGVAATGLIAYMLMPKQPRYVAIFACGIAVALFMAGPNIREEFGTIFNPAEKRDASAESRLLLWRDMWDATSTSPIIGIGPQNWPLIAPRYGWPAGKQGHGLWPQMACEIGIPGAALLAAFYAANIVKLRRLAATTSSPFLRSCAWMVISSLGGFIVEAQFGSFSGMEAPFYIGVLGAGALMLATRCEAQTHQVARKGAESPSADRLESHFGLQNEVRHGALGR